MFIWKCENSEGFLNILIVQRKVPIKHGIHHTNNMFADVYSRKFQTFTWL